MEEESSFKKNRDLLDEIQNKVQAIDKGWEGIGDSVNRASKASGIVLSHGSDLLELAKEQVKEGRITDDMFNKQIDLVAEINSGQLDMNGLLGKEEELLDQVNYYKSIGHDHLANQYQAMLGIVQLEGKRHKQEALTEGLLDKMDGLTGGMIGNVREFGNAFKGVNKGVTGTLAIVGLVIGLMTAISSQTDAIGDEFGAIGVTDFRSDLVGATAEATKLGYGFDEVAGSVSALSNEFGVAFGEAIDISKASMSTARAIGISTDQAAGLTGQLMTISGHSADSAQNFLKQTAALAKSAGVAPGAVMEDMASSTEEIATYTKGSGENIAQAAVKARSMGMALGDVAKIADGLLDFGSSLEAEMTASVMIGRQLNLQKARELALAGDLAGLQDEILTQVGSEAEFNEMNALQRKALADSIGVGVDQMSKMVKESGKSTQQLARMRELDISEIVDKEAMGNITIFMNNLKAIGVTMLGAVASVTNFFAGFGDGWGVAGTILTLLGIAIVGIGLYLLSTALSAYATGAGLKAAGVGAKGAGAGLATMAASGSVAIPLLLTIALVGASVALIFASIGYVLSKLPPVIDSIAGGFVLIAQAITGSLLKLATPEVVLGIMGLAGAFWMLAGALIAVAYAGVMAIPAMVAVTGFTAAMSALGAVGAAGEGESPETLQLDQIREAVSHMATKMDDLVKGFGGKPATEGAYIEPIVNDNKKTKTVRVTESRW